MPLLPASDTWAVRRGRLMFSTLYNTAARVSELTTLKIADVSLESNPAVRILGKGRKERQVPPDRCPLWNSTARQIKRWLQEQGPGRPEQLLFPNRKGGRLTRTTITNDCSLPPKRPREDIPNSPVTKSLRM